MNRTILFSFVFLFLFVPAEVFAQAPLPEWFGSGTVDSCRTRYSMAYSPLVTAQVFGCVSNSPNPSDMDQDGFWDLGESELLWAFAPWINFDAEENLHDGVTLVYQALPKFDANLDRYLLKYVFVFLFREDSEHTGDSETMSMTLATEPGDVQALTWRLWELTYRSDSGTCYLLDGDPNGVEVSLFDDELTDLVCNPVSANVEFPGDYAAKWYFDYNSSTQGMRNDSGMIHPVVFISRNKHGLYRSERYCEMTCHSTEGWEACGHSGTPNGLIFPGMPIDKDYFNWYPPGGRFSEEWARILGDSGAPVSDLEKQTFIRLGNLGEKQHLLIDDLGENGTGWFPGESVRRGKFCGGLACEGDVGGSIYGKMKNPMNPVPSCSAPDNDGDGVPNAFDCEPTNQYLGIDLDRDGWCDKALEPQLLEECRTACNNGDRLAQTHCQEKCMTSDPCAIPSLDDQNPCQALISEILGGTYGTGITENALYRECRRLYGNQMVTLVDDRRVFTKAAACSTGPWSITAAAFRPTQSLIFKPGLDDGGFFKCTTNQLHMQVLYGKDQAVGMAAVSTDRPTSLMVCGCDPFSNRPCDEQCMKDIDPPSVDLRIWKPLRLSETQWPLPTVFGAVQENEADNQLFRHKALPFSPRLANRRASIAWLGSDFSAMDEKKVVLRASHPTRPPSFNGTQEQTLLSEERSATPYSPSDETFTRQICVPATKGDLDVGTDEERLDVETWQEMGPIRVIPGVASPGEDFWTIRKPPNESPAIAILQAFDASTGTGNVFHAIHQGSTTLTTDKLASSPVTLIKGRATQFKSDARWPDLLLVVHEGQVSIAPFEKDAPVVFQTWSPARDLDGLEPPVITAQTRMQSLGNALVAFATPRLGATQMEWTIHVVDLVTNVTMRDHTFSAPYETADAPLWFDADLERVFFLSDDLGVEPVHYVDLTSGQWTPLNLSDAVIAGEAPLVVGGPTEHEVRLLSSETGSMYGLDLVTGEVQALGSISMEPTTSGALVAYGDSLVYAEPADDNTTIEIAWLSPDGVALATTSTGLVEEGNELYPQPSAFEPETTTCKTCQDGGCTACAGAPTDRRGNGFVAILLIAGLIWVRRRRK